MNLVFVLLAVVFGLMLLVNPAIGSGSTRFRRSWWSGVILGDDSEQSGGDSDSNHPPSFNNCPSETIEITAPENMMTAIVTWAELTVSNFKVDSDSNMLEIQQRSGPVRNTNQPEGSYLVEYEAMFGGDLVDYCSFLVVVKVIRCDCPPIQFGGFQCSSTDIIHGTTCNFTCGDRYIMQGSQNASCLSTGEFDTLPTCERYRCDSPIIKYGEFQCSSSEIIFGSICNFTCGDRYMIQGSPTAICLSTEQFDTLPTCTRYRCDSPIIKYGEFQCSSSEMIFGSICNFTCGYRYMIQGSPTATCLSTGQFDTLPTCARYRCDSPIIKYGEFQCSSSEIIFGSICNFTCGDRYMIQGSPTATCLSTGQFDTLPTCALFKCDNPCIEYGRFDCTPSDISFGSICMFTCSIGFMLVGEETATCLETGELTTVPYCEEIDECESSPCENEGSCTDLFLDYSCACIPGYTGDNCAINIDDCEEGPCQNGGTCTDLVNDYSCDCVIGYTGVNCQIMCDITNPIDLVFILDQSGSLGLFAFSKMLLFSASVVEEFIIGSSATRVAFITFGDDAITHFYLNTHSTKQAIKDDILDTFYPIELEDTYTDLGLKMAREEIFTTANGDRATAPNVAVVITDGLSTNATSTAAQAQLLHQSGVKVLAVGVGFNSNLNELNAIATDPDAQNVFVNTDFTTLESIKDEIIQGINCDG